MKISNDLYTNRSFDYVVLFWCTLLYERIKNIEMIIMFLHQKLHIYELALSKELRLNIICCIMFNMICRMTKITFLFFVKK